MGRNCSTIAMVVLLFAALACAAAPERAQSAGPDALIHRADDLKTADNGTFVAIVRALDAQARSLTPLQRQWLRYLEAWQRGYTGDVAGALPELSAVAREAPDVALRFRALVTLVNGEALIARYDDAYAHLDALLALQPHVVDNDARVLGYAVAALLYNYAGQYDLGIADAERWLAEDHGDVAACKASYLKLDALFRSGKLVLGDAQVQQAIDACNRIREPLFANMIRVFIANLALDRQRPADAIDLLSAHDGELQATNSARVRSEFHSILARAYLMSGDLRQAREYARSAVDLGIREEASRPLVDAYAVLAEVAKRDGDFKSALEWHEQYTNAERQYLGTTRAQALAYQMVNQHVIDKRREVERLQKENQLLQLRERVVIQSEETQHLYILLLLLVIGFVALWSYRLKRSQMRFQKLARRDGLTGIVNRQHFMDQAKAMLQAASRSGQECCLILVDLDNFKSVNDTHGHVAGDGVLKQTVGMCQLHMRADALFGRLGGEEFGVLLPDCALETARERAEELRAAIAAFAQAGVEVTVSASFGVASTRTSGYDLRQMLIHADSALYRAKRHGRNRVEAFLVSLAGDAGLSGLFP